ncbi:MAG: hypothetical protein D6719_01935 [Candidatus Dadabacteria bacterium]|nr:MAG: hypothetical protein D6719_01935 [Candidatus Dadabacteria bacterium]
MSYPGFINIAEELEIAGLVWRPEIGDEVSPRKNYDKVSILVDPQGMTPDELRETYLWLPTVEQMVTQFEIRQAIIFHLGLELSEASMCYKTVIQSPAGPIETRAQDIREAVGLALRDLLLSNESSVH